MTKAIIFGKWGKSVPAVLGDLDLSLLEVEDHAEQFRSRPRLLVLVFAVDHFGRTLRLVIYCWDP